MSNYVNGKKMNFQKDLKKKPSLNQVNHQN
jgi:hypothetical protein